MKQNTYFIFYILLRVAFALPSRHTASMWRHNMYGNQFLNFFLRRPVPVSIDTHSVVMHHVAIGRNKNQRKAEATAGGNTTIN